MGILTDTEIRKIRNDAMLMGATIDQSDLWHDVNWNERSLADLVILKAGWEAFIAEADKRIAERVSQGRVAGASWAEIGKILGISKQAAQQKFGAEA